MIGDIELLKRDWANIRFIGDMLGARSADHPRLARLSQAVTFRFVQLNAEKAGIRPYDVDVPAAHDDPAGYDKAAEAALALRNSVCCSSLYFNVPLDVQLHVTVLANYMYHLAHYAHVREVDGLVSGDKAPVDGEAAADSDDGTGKVQVEVEAAADDVGETDETTDDAGTEHGRVPEFLAVGA